MPHEWDDNGSARLCRPSMLTLGSYEEKQTMNMKIEKIKTHATFESLFPINQKVLEKIQQDMRDGRYDGSQPVILATWEGQKEPVCIDGHTRLRAASSAGLTEVPVWFHEFDTEQEALEKAIKLQRNRRSMTDAEILTCVETLDERKQRGGDRRSGEAQSKVQHCPIENGHSSSAQETGSLLGISERKVKQTRTVMDHADEETKAAVKQGGLSINKAYQKTQDERREAKSDNAKKRSRDKKGKATGKSKGVAELTQSVSAKRGPLSAEHFEALSELGGSLEEHVATAIDLYLESLRPEDSKLPVEMHEYGADAEQDESEDEDDDEYFNPNAYDATPDKYDDEEYF